MINFVQAKEYVLGRCLKLQRLTANLGPRFKFYSVYKIMWIHTVNLKHAPLITHTQDMNMYL